MNCNYFSELSKELKIRIINKCRPISYVRLRRTCKLLDEFCEENRADLGVCCYRSDAALRLDYDYSDDGISNVSITDNANVIKIAIPYFDENSHILKKAVSGFSFPNVHIQHTGFCENKSVTSFIEATPYLKIETLELSNISAKQAKLIMASSWKIRKLTVHYFRGISGFFKCNALKNIDHVSAIWSYRRKKPAEESVVEMARRKTTLELGCSDFSSDFVLHIFRRLIKVWKDEDHTPKSFKISWEYSDKYSNQDIFEMYNQRMNTKAAHLGTFTQRNRRNYNCVFDVWIVKSKEKWQIISIEKAHSFVLETIESKTDFIKKLLDLLPKICPEYVVNYSQLLEALEKLDSLEKIKEEFNLLLSMLDTYLLTLMAFPRFLDLPPQLVVRIIRKCSVTTFTRLRRTCKFLDDFCEENRTALNMVSYDKDPCYFEMSRVAYCEKQYFLFMKHQFYSSNNDIPLIMENVPVIEKIISGLAFPELRLINSPESGYLQFDEALSCLLEAAPRLKIGTLKMQNLSVDHVKRLLECTWKTREIHFNCPGEMRKILDIEGVKKMDPVGFTWQEDEIEEQEMVDLARGKNNISFELRARGSPSTLKALKKIVKNWKIDGHFPTYFYVKWNEHADHFDVDISSFYQEILVMPAAYVGNFIVRDQEARKYKKKYDIWIRNDDEIWEIVAIRRCLEGWDAMKRTEVELTFETIRSRAEFISKLTAFLPKIFPNARLEESYSRLQLSPLSETIKKLETLKEIQDEFCKIERMIPPIWKKEINE